VKGYKVVELLGSGAFGQVFLVEDELKPNQLYALKIIDPNFIPDQDMYEAAKLELPVLDQLKQKISLLGEWPENIVQYIKHWEDNGTFYILMEFCPDGSLDGIISAHRNPKKKFREDYIKAVCFQIATGLSILHAQGCLHRDIKPENLLCVQPPILKIADYNVSKFVEKSKMAQSVTGTERYMSPQVQMGQDYGKLCDIWSLGVILLEMMTLKKSEEIWRKNNAFIFNKQHYEIPKYWAQEVVAMGYSKEFAEFVGKMLETEESARMSAKDIIASGLFNEIQKERTKQSGSAQPDKKLLMEFQQVRIKLPVLKVISCKKNSMK